MEEVNNELRSPTDILSIMLATDIHLGYMENDPVRGEDSFIAFEEVLSLAVEYDVDLILLGGDLFDHAKPSPNCMLQCTRLMRKYCFGDKPIAVEMLSDQLENFARNVNYEDPNLNISYPILSIHGNHDDPVGQGAVSSLDILSSMGLVNYFGKWSDYSHVRISPVLLKKGDTRLALYGLSHLKDQRLSRLFKDDKVVIECLPDGDDWFNLMVLHQNRADRGPNNFISEACLPKFLDLVMWGHEHDCRITEEFNGNYYVTQPGSTVATSLSVGESLPKHCALLQVHKKKFILKPIPLKSVRPFIFKTIVLSEENLGEATVKENEKVQEFLKNKVQEAVEEAARLRTSHPRQPELPLVRLSVFYQHEGQDFNRIRFGQNFTGVVANPNDILMMKKEKRSYEKKTNGFSDESAELSRVVSDGGDALDVAALLQQYYCAGAARLAVLSARAMADAVRDFTIKNDDHCFRSVIDAHVRHCVQRLMESEADTEEAVAERLLQCKEALDTMDADRLQAIMKAPPPAPVLAPVEESRRGGRGRGRGARASNTRAEKPSPAGRRGRPPAAAPPPSPPPERRTPRRTAATRAGASWLQDAVVTRSPRVSLRRLDDATIQIDDSD